MLASWAEMLFWSIGLESRFVARLSKVVKPTEGWGTWDNIAMLDGRNMFRDVWCLRISPTTFYADGVLSVSFHPATEAFFRHIKPYNKEQSVCFCDLSCWVQVQFGFEA